LSSDKKFGVFGYLSHSVTDKAGVNSAEVSSDNPVTCVCKSVDGIRDYLFKDAKIVNVLPELSMSELIKRTKELGFTSSTNQGI
jgi:hypothetical protein